MGEINTILKEMAASIYMKPCTFDELRKRDFMRGKSEYGVNVLTNMLLQKDWCYMKKDVFYTRKKFAEGKEMSEYGLVGLHPKLERPTIDQVVNKWRRGQF